VFALDADISRQSSQPFRSKAAPHHQSHERRDNTEDHDEFPQLAHDSKVARTKRRHKLEEMPVQFRDYYETLGVPKTATDDEIRTAFRKLARKHHPDVAKDKKAAEEKFKEINEAYEVLSDPEKRKKYDQLGADWNRPGGFQPPPEWQWQGQQPGGGFYQWGGDGGGVQFEFGGTGFSDFFEAFFGGGRGRSAFGGFGGRQATAERGADVEADIMVTLEEALHGSTRTVSLRRAGSDKVENYQVKIPRGVHEGQRIRLRGQGEAGVRGGKSGDLFLRVRLARHPDFTVEGSDLIHEVKIEPWRAVLGSELVVPTLEGNVRLKIPPGTQGGQRFRLRERGLPGVSGKRGDLYVVVQINVPKKLTEREREIWSELAKLHGG
jgi:curved DNA-binding protein